MKPRKLYFLLLFLIFYHSVSAQSFNQTIYNFCPDSTIASGNFDLYADDSFFIAAGQTRNDTLKAQISYMATFDYNLKPLHQKVLYFPGNNSGVLSSTVLTKVGNDRYLLVGVDIDSHINPRVVVYQPFFFFCNHNLDSLSFVKYVDTVRTRDPFSITQDKQKNILVCGDITSSTLIYDTWGKGWYPDSDYVWVAKYDSNANLIWEYGYPHDSSFYAYKIIVSNDSKAYFIAGVCTNPKIHYQDNFIAKIDTGGKLLWWKYLPRPSISFLDIDIISLKHGNYAFLADYNDSVNTPDGTGGYGVYKSYFYYGKFNDNGDTLWTHFYKSSANYFVKQITEGTNGDLVMLGNSDSLGAWPAVLRTDSNGHIKYFRKYLYKDTLLLYEQLNTVSILKNQQLLLGGELTARMVYPGVFDSVGSISWYMLTDTFGCTTPGCQLGDTVWQHETGLPVDNITGQVAVYPNPAQQYVYIKLSGGNEIIDAKLTDESGRLLATKELHENSTSAIDVSNLPAGIYFLELWKNGHQVKVYKVNHY